VNRELTGAELRKAAAPNRAAPKLKGPWALESAEGADLGVFCQLWCPWPDQLRVGDPSPGRFRMTLTLGAGVFGAG